MTVLELNDVSLAGIHTMTITGSILDHIVKETFDLEIINPCGEATTSQILFSDDVM